MRRSGRRFAIELIMLVLVSTLLPAQSSEAQQFGSPAIRPQARDIVDLIQEGRVEAAVTGSGIQEVSVRLRRTGAAPIDVRVPVGTFFVAGQASAQNMVSRAEMTVTLSGTDWVTLRVPAACANRPRDIPTASNSFTVTRSPQQAELQRLVPILGKARATFAVAQAAVWILTDNADFDDLGILQRTSGYGGPVTRVIMAEDAARAMQMVDGAGIDIRAKAIFRDRQRLAPMIREDGLRKWLDAL